MYIGGIFFVFIRRCGGELCEAESGILYLSSVFALSPSSITRMQVRK